MEDDGLHEVGKTNAKIKVIRLEECFAYLGKVPLEQIYEEASQNDFNVSNTFWSLKNFEFLTPLFFGIILGTRFRADF